MRRRRHLARVALALVALGTGLLFAPAPSGAASASKSAWWSRASDPVSAAPPAVPNPGATLPAPPPRPDVPEGSVLVEGTPSGSTAIAAITYTLLATESSPSLTITPSASSNVPDDAVILACRAALPWTAPEAQPGSWGEKPLVDCGRSVNGIIADGTITFPVAPLVSGTDLDIVLVPGTTGETTPAGNVGSAFSLSFDTASGAVLTTSSTSSSSGSGSSFTPPPSSSSGSGSGFSVGGSSFTPPASPSPAGVVAPALEPQEQAPTVPSTPLPGTAAAAVADNDTARGVAFIILLIGAALAGLAYLTPERDGEGTVGLGRFRRPEPATINAAVVSVEGGLGRFARPRTGPPPALS